MSLPTLMVLDGEIKATLGIVRSLGRRGIQIMVGSSNPRGRSGFSRYAQRRFTYIPPNKDLAIAHSMIMRRVQEWRPDILMPLFTAGWEVVYAFYEEYSGLTTVVPNPGKELFESLYDKGLLADYADEHEVQIPMTFCPQTMKEAVELRESLPYPVLLKPRKAVDGAGIQLVTSPAELVAVLRQFQRIPVIQEKIEGEDLELTILCIDGLAIAGSAYISLRNMPLPYGPPVACRTIRDKTLMRTGMEFLRRLHYHGVAHLDFRRDKRDGQAKLLDFNPRIAGSNDSSLCSGVDFAYMLYQLARGEKVDPRFDYELGKEFRYLWPGELRHLAQTDCKSQTVSDLLRWDNVDTDISLFDPLPNFIDVINHLPKMLWLSRKK